MKLWQKDTKTENAVDKFTVGRDRELDVHLAAADILGSLAHTQMLESIGLLTKDELIQIQEELKSIFKDVEKGDFKIDSDIEDVHSQIEFLLTQRIGEAGKKIHSGRSRNDQVLVDLKLFLRSEIEHIVNNTNLLFSQLISLSEKHKTILDRKSTRLNSSHVRISY